MKSIAFFLALLPAMLFAQTPDTIPVIPNPVTPDGLNVEWLINAENGLYSGLLFVLSFLSFLIPGIKKIPAKSLRTLAIGASLILLFVGNKAATGAIDVMEVVSLIVSYLLTTQAYDKIFRPIGLTTPATLPAKNVSNE